MNSRVLMFYCDLNTHKNSVYQNFLKVNLGTTVTYRLRPIVVMCSFQCLHHQQVFQEKQLLYL